MLISTETTEIKTPRATEFDRRDAGQQPLRWYVIQVRRGSEAAMAALLGRVVSGDVLDECFFPQYQTEMKVRGQWVPCTRPLFDGYLIAVCRDPEALEDALTHIPEFARVLAMGERFVPLAREDVELIGGFTSKGERVVPMSYAVKDGERVVVTSGPLVGREGLITSVNRRKSVAYLETDICGRTVAVRVGLGILSPLQTSEAKALAGAGAGRQTGETRISSAIRKAACGVA